MYKQLTNFEYLPEFIIISVFNRVINIKTTNLSTKWFLKGIKHIYQMNRTIEKQSYIFERIFKRIFYLFSH